jgi:SAM-dependent methyltransferase
MRLGALRRHWERLARRDPYWAVLTAADKRGGRWDIDEFFASGDAEIEAVLQRATERGIDLPRRRALDFGCGAGRLTQALAARFERSDGVDVSEAMVRLARSHNRHGERCAYHLNTASDLGRFPDATFDFVYTTLVLQHMVPRLSTGYIRELVRVLHPDGVLVFQVPSARSTVPPPAAATRSPSRRPLPRAAFAAGLHVPEPPSHASPSQEINLDVRIENRSPVEWPSLPGPLGRYRVSVANRWLTEAGDLVTPDDGRCPLEHDVPSRGRTGALLVVTSPATEGRYLLEIDLVQEDVAWFSERGSAPLRLPVIVGSGRSPSVPKPPPPPPPKFSQRYPRAFRVMRATGIRAAYWAWRRTLDRVKRQRDRLIVWARETFTFPRVTRWLRRQRFAPRMEMHTVPEAEVAAQVAAAGGRIVDVEREVTPGYVSCRYWVRKSRGLEAGDRGPGD